MSAPAVAPVIAEVDLILARVRAHAALRTAWLRRLWDEQGVPAGIIAVTHAEADAALAGADDPAAEASWRAGPEAAPLTHHAAAVDERLAARVDGRLAGMARVFGLDAADRDLLALAFAVAVDPSLGRLCGYLHDHPEREHASEPLAVRVFGHPAASWPPDSPLLRWHLVERLPATHGGPAAVVCDPQVVAWLLGRHHVDGALAGRAGLAAPASALAGWPVAETIDALSRLLEDGARARVVVRAGAGEGRRTFAATVAAGIGLPALTVDASEPVPEELGLRASRQAFLDEVALVWVGDGAARLPQAATPLPFPVQFVCVDRAHRPPGARGVVDLVVDLPPPSTPDRRQLWLQHYEGASTWPPAELAELAARFRASPAEIVAAAAAAPGSAAEAAQLVQRTTAERAGMLAQRLECPFEPDDLILPERLRGVLDEFVHEGAARTAFWEEPAARRLFPTGRALVALFAGPPGTGKTMAAQVIARRLGFDLWRVDLSSLVSKYVGETAENIERLLGRAAGADVVLLFDEADALYGKRATEVRDAQDRYVNMDTGHLMVAVENHDGVVVLATNQKGAIDPAFLRRLRYVVDFPKPDAADRLVIWQRIVAGLAGPAAAESLSGDLQVLADAVDATGSQIKYAVLGGAFAARRAGAGLAREHLLAGLTRELGKEGRSLSRRDLDRLGQT